MSVSLHSSLTACVVRKATWVQLAGRILSMIGEGESELSVNLVGDVRIRRLNRDYRKKDRATDVLAFPIREAMMPRGIQGPTGLLGDVVISVPTAVRQAQDAGRTVSEELITLLVHGILHLCGYDHERNDREAARMFRREHAILQRLGPIPRLVSFSTRKRRKRH